MPGFSAEALTFLVFLRILEGNDAQVSSFTDVQARRCGGVACLKPLADQAMGLGLLLPSDETSGAPPKTGNRPQCKVSYGNHYVCLLQVAQNWLGLRGDTFRRRLRIAFTAVCKWLHRRIQPSKLARKPAKEKTSCILRSRISKKTKKVKASAQKPVTSFEDSSKKTQTKDRREMAATSGICRGTGGICLRSLVFLVLFGNPRRK